MSKFKLYWLDGKTEIIEGDSISDAFTHAGYGAGALKALDWHETMKRTNSITDDLLEVCKEICTLLKDYPNTTPNFNYMQTTLEDVIAKAERK